MSLLHFPSLIRIDQKNYTRIKDVEQDWSDQQYKLFNWKLEHERLYYCIPKAKLDEFIRYVDDPPQWNWSEYNRRKRELYASTEEQKKSLGLGSDGCKICGKPIENGNSFCLKHIVENLEEPNK